MKSPGTSGIPGARTRSSERTRRATFDPRSATFNSRRGQSIVESVFVMVVLCLIFFAALELSRVFAGTEIVDHAASTGVRAKTVGFNDFMVDKVVRVATIPNAGPMTSPITTRIARRSQAYYEGVPVHQQWENSLNASPGSPHLAIERSRIPLYLGAESWGNTSAILDYENWESVYNARELDDGRTVGVVTRQAFPMVMPLTEFFYGRDEFPMRGEAWQADHSGLYLE